MVAGVEFSDPDELAVEFLENLYSVFRIVVERFAGLGVGDAQRLWNKRITYGGAGDFEFRKCCFLTFDDRSPNIGGLWCGLGRHCGDQVRSGGSSWPGSSRASSSVMAGRARIVPSTSL